MMKYSDFRVRAEHFFPPESRLKLRAVSVIQEYVDKKPVRDIGYAYEMGCTEMLIRFKVKIEGETKPAITNEDLMKSDKVYVKLVNGFVNPRYKSQWELEINVTADKVVLEPKTPTPAPIATKK